MPYGETFLAVGGNQLTGDTGPETQLTTIYIFNKVKTVSKYLQGSAKRRSPGLVHFVPAVAYHFCLNLPAAFTQPGARLLAKPCT